MGKVKEKTIDFCVKHPGWSSLLISLGIPGLIEGFFEYMQRSYGKGQGATGLSFAMVPFLFYLSLTTLKDLKTFRDEGLSFENLTEDEKPSFLEGVCGLKDRIKNREVKQFFIDLYDLPYKHPVVFGGLFAAEEFVRQQMGSRENIDYTLDQLAKHPVSIPLIYLLLGFGGYIFLNTAGQILRSDRVENTYQLVKNTLLFNLGRKKGKEKAIRNLEEFHQKKATTEVGEVLASFQSKRGQRERSLVIRKNNLRNEDGIRYYSFFRKLKSLHFIGSLRKLSVPGRYSIGNYTNIALEEARIGCLGEAKDTILRGVDECYYPSDDPLYRVETMIYSAYALDAIGQTDGAREQWRKAVVMIKQIPGLRDRFERIENYDVFRLRKGRSEKERLLQKEVIIKGGVVDERPLRKEEFLSKVLLERLRDTEFSSVEPIDVFDVEGLYYLAQRHAAGKRLSDYVAEGGDIGAVRKAARHLGFINAVMDPGLVGNHYDPKKQLEQRLGALPGENAQRIWDNLGFVFKNYEEYPTVFNKDGHDENFFVGENGKSISLDVEDRGVTHPQEDAALLYFLGNAWPRSISGYEEMEQSIEEDYYSTFRDHYKNGNLPNSEQFVFQVQKSSIPKILHFVCATLDRPIKRQRARESLQNALFIMDFLQERKVSYLSSADDHQINALRKEFQTLLKIG